MANPVTEPAGNSKTDLLTKTGHAAATIVKGGAEALTGSTAAYAAASADLAKAYQELAARNAKNLTAAIHSLSGVKNPAEFLELQQKLVKDGVEGAVHDIQAITQLTVAVFTAAFEPVKKQIEALQKTALN
nr:phasin family protein [uncultured Rhodopila sp.]